MDISRCGIPKILPDNDEQYLVHILKCIEVVDNDCEAVIWKNINGYNFNIRCEESLKTIMIKQISEAHLILGLQVQFSSHKSSPFITFRLIATA